MFYIDRIKDVSKIIDYLKVGSLHNVISYFWWGGIEIKYLHRRGDGNRNISWYFLTNHSISIDHGRLWSFRLCFGACMGIFLLRFYFGGRLRSSIIVGSCVPGRWSCFHARCSSTLPLHNQSYSYTTTCSSISSNSTSFQYK